MIKNAKKAQQYTIVIYYFDNDDSIYTINLI